MSETEKPPPPYLARTEPMEIEDAPLQLALLTQEVAAHRAALKALSKALATIALQLMDLAASIDPPDFPDLPI